MAGGSNNNGKCTDSPVWLTREPDENAIGDTMRSMVGQFPVVGPLIGGLIPDTYTQNVVRSCPGATKDHVSDYAQEYTLMAIIVGLIIIYLIA